MPQHPYFWNRSKDFAFKCHRDATNAWAVNSISFHPGHGTFATGGADGIVALFLFLFISLLPFFSFHCY
jgi:WD40 repeat protein